MGLPINKLCCQHCGEENPNFFKFGSIDMINQQARMLNNVVNQNYEFTPKYSVGFFFECAKCGKHTVIIPDSYSYREMNNFIPQQIIYSPTFKQPEFSATSYIIVGSGLLDKVVKTNEGKTVSLITRQEVMNDGTWKFIDKDIYNICLAQGFKEVSNVQSATINGNVGTNFTTEPNKSIYSEVAINDTTGTATMDAKSNANATTTKE